jgi:DNA polymerase V
MAALVANDYEEIIDLSKALVQHPNATPYYRVTEDGMTGANMPADALLVVDRSLRASSRNIVVGILDGVFTVRRRIRTARAWILHPETSPTNPL